MNALKAALAFLARYWIIAVLLCAVVFFASTLKACHEAGRVEQAVADNPPVPKKQAKALIAKSRADSTKAVVATKIAHVYHKRADSALAVAKTLTAQADSIHAQTVLLPAAARGPISAIERDLRAYQSPDTTGQ